jgi:hypothetical protein
MGVWASAPDRRLHVSLKSSRGPSLRPVFGGDFLASAILYKDNKRSRHCCPSIPCPFLVAPDPSPTVEGQCLVGGDGRRPSAVGPSRSPRPGGRIGDDGGAAAGTDAGGRTVGRSGRMPPAWRGLDGRAEIDRRVRHPPIVGSGPAGRRKAGRCRGAPLRPRGAGTPAKRG